MSFSPKTSSWLLPLTLMACAAPTSPVDSAGSRAIPRPTEHILDEGAEARHKDDRRAWIREMHRTAPGLDWRAIDLQNGEVEMERRALLATQSALSFGAAPWSEVGSRNQAGRMHCALLSPDGSTLYAGSSLGGVWRANPDGTNWTPLGDNLFGGSRRLAILEPAQIGDPDVILSATSSNQIRITQDAGQTWTVPSGLPNFSNIRELRVLADAQSTVLVFGKASGATRLWASTDRGNSFQIRWTAANEGDSSLFIPRRGAESPNTIYMLHKGRLRVSLDKGFNFALRGTLDTNATDMHLVGSEAGAPTLYASIRVNGDWKLHRSDDAGFNWSYVNDMDGYWSALEASSTNASQVTYGGVDPWVSTNGGQNFQRINGWGEYYGDPLTKLHADQQGIFCVYDPTVPGTNERWYYCNDGGIYLSEDGTQNMLNLCMSGLGVSQYYSTLTSSSNNDHISAGSQDQGYQVGVFQPSTGPGPSTNFNQVISGDYGHLTSSDGSHDLVYSTYPGFTLVQEGSPNPVLRTINFPSGANHLWLPPVVADPDDAGTFYFLGDQLWQYDRVTPGGWTHNLHSTTSFTAGSASYLSGMAFSPADSGRVYAVNNRGRFYVSDDHGVNWTQSPGDGADSHYFYGNALAAHPVDKDEAFCGGSGYSNPGVYRTQDGGQSWQALGNGLPSTLVFDLAYAKDGTGDVYAATAAGAYHWDRTDAQWHNVMELGTPLTEYWSVEAVPGLPLGEAVMRFATYGRGIWDYDVPQGTTGTWTTYGEGASVNNRLTLSSPTAPNLGTTLKLVVDGVVLNGQGAPGWILAGRQKANVPMLGGVQLVGQVLRTFVIPLDINGGGSYEFFMPNVPAWLGTAIRFQAFAPDLAGSSGFTLSQGLEAVFGI